MLCLLLCALVAHAAAAKIAVVALKTTSHENVLRALAEALQARGHDVALCVNAESVAAHQRASPQLRVLSAGPLPHPMSHYAYTHTLPDFLRMQGDASAAALAPLQRALAAFAPRALVFDALFPLGHALSTRLGVQPVAVSCGSRFLHFVGFEAPPEPFLASGLARRALAIFRTLVQAGVVEVRLP